ncbi:MAG: hypothetical protein HXN15_06535 [Porphyromonadaceae bacterium]|nr:hypothetical protein [Porphyromonadaceae bacterium]
MKRSHSVRIKAPKGQMVVSRERRSVGYLVRCPKQDAHLYELMDEAEARALEAQWKAEDEAKAKAEAEAGEAQP